MLLRILRVGLCAARVRSRDKDVVGVEDRPHNLGSAGISLVCKRHVTSDMCRDMWTGMGIDTCKDVCIRTCAHMRIRTCVKHVYQ